MKITVLTVWAATGLALLALDHDLTLVYTVLSVWPAYRLISAEFKGAK